MDKYGKQLASIFGALCNDIGQQLQLGRDISAATEARMQELAGKSRQIEANIADFKIKFADLQSRADYTQAALAAINVAVAQQADIVANHTAQLADLSTEMLGHLRDHRLQADTVEGDTAPPHPDNGEPPALNTTSDLESRASEVRGDWLPTQDGIHT